MSLVVTGPYENSMTGLKEWVVTDTVAERDVKRFVGPFAQLRARLYVRLHDGA